MAVKQLSEPQAEQKDKIALVTYNYLRIDKTKEASTTKTPHHKTISTLLSLTDKHESDKKKGGDSKLSPINSN